MKPDFNYDKKDVLMSFEVVPSKMKIRFDPNHKFDRNLLKMLADAGWKIIICSHGAGGKDFLKNQLVDIGLKPEVSYTTRPMREGEIEGKTYHYITKERFESMDKNWEFLQWKEFNGWMYGTPLLEFEHKNLFIMTPPALRDLESSGFRNRCVVVFINIDRIIREKRLSGRNDADNPTRRLVTDDELYHNYSEYGDWNIQITNPFF